MGPSSHRGFALRDVLKLNLRRDTKRVAHIAGQLRAVERVKMQAVNAFVDQIGTEFGAQRGECVSAVL